MKKILNYDTLTEAQKKLFKEDREKAKLMIYETPERTLAVAIRDEKDNELKLKEGNIDFDKTYELTSFFYNNKNQVLTVKWKEQ